MAIKKFKANADLTGKIGHAVEAHANGGEVNVANTAKEVCLGILVNEAKSGKPVSVALSGEVCKVVLGVGGADCGSALTTDANGKLVKSTTNGDFVIAVALEDGVAGDKIYAEVVKFTQHA